MLTLHATVFAQPASFQQGPVVELRQHSLPTLAGPQGGPPALTEPLRVPFEAIQQQLAAQTHCDYEPDGFFLITGRRDGQFWRLNGHMHEHAGAMHRIELNGECPVETFDTVLTAIGWPQTALVFQLVQEGVTLAETDFRRWAANG